MTRRTGVQGLEHTSTNEVPLEGQPLNGKEIDEMMQHLQAVSLSDWYLNVGVHVPKIEAMLQVVGKDAPWVHLLTSRALEVHMQA